MNRHIAPLVVIVFSIILMASCVDKERIVNAVVTRTSTPSNADTNTSDIFETPVSAPSATVNSTPIVFTPESTPQPTNIIQPSTTHQILITPTPETVIIKANDTDGSAEWHAAIGGTYLITFKQGAYSGWKDDSECSSDGCWKTTIFAYRNCEVVRDWRGDLMEPVNPSFRIGLDPWQLTPEDAENLALDVDPKREDFQAGECVKFIAIDGVGMEDGEITWSSYLDNRGTVTLEISLLNYATENTDEN